MALRVTFFLVGMAVVAVSRPAGAQTSWRGRCETPFFLQLRSGVDSNPLRLAKPARVEGAPPRVAADPAEPGGETGNTADSGQMDASAHARPSFGLRCAISPASTLGITYTAGIARYQSTTALNTMSHELELRFQRRFSPGWTGEAYISTERSNQPDILSTSTTLNFANYTEQGVGLRGVRRTPGGSMFAEYSAHGRRYSRLTSSALMRQSDTLHSLAIGRWWAMSSQSFLTMRLEYRQNQSNDRIFRYREPIASVTYSRLLGNGFRIDATQRLRRISFVSRPVSTDPQGTRSDVIPGFSLALRKEFWRGVAGIAQYSFDKDFSSEPRRRFSDHRVFMGVDVSFGRSRRPASLFSTDADVLTVQAIQIANLGYEEIKRGNWSEALRLSLDAARIDPSLPEAHTNAGVAYYMLGNIPAAIQEWNESLALRPDERVRALLNKVSASARQ